LQNATKFLSNAFTDYNGVMKS
jgi:hypothetical protein